MNPAPADQSDVRGEYVPVGLRLPFWICQLFGRGPVLRVVRTDQS